MKNGSKVLIIKVGHSETLDPEISNMTSYGDVLRTTVLLHLFKEDDVTWLVDEWAYPILKGNKYINRIMIYNLSSVLQLQAEYFDTVINLEKVPGLCALTDSINAWRRFGFRFNEKKGCADAYEGTQQILAVCLDIEKKKNYSSYWQQGLYEMVNARWGGEEYVFDYKPKTKIIYDIGFNYQVGNKWASKSWPLDYWKRLEKIIGGKYNISWQQGLEDMEKYFDWIHSCRLIVTNDSFGLHLAIAMKKYIIGLFGPTSVSEIYLYNRGRIIGPNSKPCDNYPCFASECRINNSCMKRICPEDVSNEINLAFKKGKVKK